MARPRRIQKAGGSYFITVRCNRRMKYLDDIANKRLLLDKLGKVVESYNWYVYGYCILPDHYHLIIETPNANLGKGMRQLNGTFTQDVNRRERMTGQLFAQHYRSILFEKQDFLLPLVAYMVRNPVRYALVNSPSLYTWSSYQPMMGKRPVPKWLDIDEVLEHFSKNRDAARRQFSNYMRETARHPSPLNAVKHQSLLGSQYFVNLNRQEDAREPVTQRERTLARIQANTKTPSIKAFKDAAETRNEGIVAAYETGVYSLEEIGKVYGLHYSTISRVVSKAKGSR